MTWVYRYIWRMVKVAQQAGGSTPSGSPQPVNKPLPHIPGSVSQPVNPGRVPVMKSVIDGTGSQSGSQSGSASTPLHIGSGSVPGGQYIQDDYSLLGSKGIPVFDSEHIPVNGPTSWIPGSTVPLPMVVISAATLRPDHPLSKRLLDSIRGGERGVDDLWSEASMIASRIMSQAQSGKSFNEAVAETFGIDPKLLAVSAEREMRLRRHANSRLSSTGVDDAGIQDYQDMLRNFRIGQEQLAREWLRDNLLNLQVAWSLREPDEKLVKNLLNYLDTGKKIVR